MGFAQVEDPLAEAMPAPFAQQDAFAEIEEPLRRIAARQERSPDIIGLVRQGDAGRAADWPVPVESDDHGGCYQTDSYPDAGGSATAETA